MRFLRFRLAGSVRTMAIRVVAVVAVSAAGVGVWAWTWRNVPPVSKGRVVPMTESLARSKGLRYSAEGFGGYATENLPPTPSFARRGSAGADLLSSAYAAYAGGRYGEAERITESLHADPKTLAKAHLLAGYCEARQKNMQRARELFARTKDEAAALADHGKRQAKLGESLASIEEEAAYQHAVCTAALGEPKEAEREYLQIMRDYPESPLVHGAIKRIALLHKREIPAEAEEVWKAAMRVAKGREEARKREQSLCGPECLAELLRRRMAAQPPIMGASDRALVHSLANEMKTTHEGTTLAALAEVANAHGLKGEGLALTAKGLERKAGESQMPLVALVNPGHYVLVEGVKPGAVSVWDPDGSGVGKPSRSTVPSAEWSKRWSGVVLAVE